MAKGGQDEKDSDNIVAGVYFGFAVMRGSKLQQQVEFNVAFLFVIAALLGMGVSPWFLPGAYLAHGLWDFANHHGAKLRLVSIPHWYIPWCVIIELGDSAGFAAVALRLSVTTDPVARLDSIRAGTSRPSRSQRSSLGNYGTVFRSMRRA